MQNRHEDNICHLRLTTSISKKLKKNKTVEKFLITCGASAGLAAAFNAPVAGILFAVEEVHRHISKKFLVVCMAATITADAVDRKSVV